MSQHNELLANFSYASSEVTLDVYSEISLVSQGAGYREEDDTFSLVVAVHGQASGKVVIWNCTL